MPPELTALRRAAPGRVTLELDGRAWRVVSDDVVVRCHLSAGLELDRPLLRELARELRRAGALAAAGRALARRDLSAHQVDERLRRSGSRAPERAETVELLVRTGLVDDARVARRRAEALAERGWGDSAIRARLAQDGIEDEFAREALSVLEPEDGRAARVTADVQDARKAAGLLARRGFDDEIVAGVLARLDVDG